MGNMGEFETQVEQPTVLGANSPWFCLQRWYQTPLGQSLLQCEKQVLDTTLPGLFGINLLQLGGINDDKLYVESKTQRQFVLEALPYGVKRLEQTAMLTQFDQLAIESDSVDVVILPHTLEFEQNPHQVLREVERILVPEGHVVYLGFNPFSWLGVRHAITQRRRNSPNGKPGERAHSGRPQNATINTTINEQKLSSCGRMLAPGRVSDWFKLLGFEVEHTERYFYQPPINSQYFLQSYSVAERLGPKLWPFFSGGYMILAEKKVSTLTPIKPKWRLTKDMLVGKSSIEPSAGYKPDHITNREPISHK